MPAKFHATVLGVPPIAAAYRRGLQALLPIDARRISCSDTGKIAGSVNIDTCLAASFPDEPRWDYVVGQSRRGDDRAHWIEVHPCKASEVKDLVKKVRWLRDWILGNARGFRNMPQVFIWLPSGKVSLLPSSPQYKQVAQEGVRISPRLYRLF